MGGLSKIVVKLPDFNLSDDTIMHIATAEALARDWKTDEELFDSFAHYYKECFKDMMNRAPGRTTDNSIRRLKPGQPNGWMIPYNPRAGGCGAAMRSMCIGLVFPEECEVEELIKVAVESGRMTHHHPTGYLGSVAGALFTSFAVQGKQVQDWGFLLMESLPLVTQYIKQAGRDVEENLSGMEYFTRKWQQYLKIRGIHQRGGSPKFPAQYGPRERDEFYNSLGNGWGGALGHDAPMIAYDALLAAGPSWERLCYHGILHGGDNDSTGTMAGAWWGVLYGLEGVPEGHYTKLEYHDRIEGLGRALYHKKASAY
eukprot:Colp12_sorted_trinity150504_noHs@27787